MARRPSTEEGSSEIDSFVDWEEGNDIDQLLFDLPPNSNLTQNGGATLQAEDEDFGNIANFYTFTRTANQFSSKFLLTFQMYECRLTHLNQIPPHRSIDLLTRLLDDILTRIKQDVATHDLIRIRIDSRTLTYPIWTPLIQCDQLTLDRWLFHVERVLNSNQNFRLDQTFSIWVQHTNLPAGSCRHEGAALLKDKLTRKSCILQIRNADELCLPRAIAVGKVLADGDSAEYERIYKSQKRQKERALEIVAAAGLDVRKYSIADASAFQAALPDHQLIIVSTVHCGIVFSGPRKAKHISVLCHDEHFDLITKLHRWFEASFFCYECMKPYNTRSRHRCNQRCKLCLRENCEQDNSQKTLCDQCNRVFLGPSCFDAHLQRPRRGRSVCQRFQVCSHCKKFLSFEKERIHKCDEVYCSTCDEWSTPADNHCCYMRTIKLEEKVYEKHAGTQCIYFDFETARNADGTFFPNLLHTLMAK